MFRYKKAVNASYDKQGHIYFISKLYKELEPWKQKKIHDLCLQAGGEYHAALFDFVTTDDGATAICMRHNLSRSTLERAVRRYYEMFPRML